MFLCDCNFWVMKRAKSSLFTASAPPAGTEVCCAACIVREPKIRISSLRSPQALPYTSPLFNELEQTSSAKSGLECAGVKARGFMSYSSTKKPSSASRQAASLPARPAPITLTVCGAIFALFVLFGQGCGVIARLFGTFYLAAALYKVALAALGALIARGNVPA